MNEKDNALLPEPLVPAEVDLRDFPFTPVFRARLFGSAFHARATDAEWRAGFTLWLRSWDQVPAGTLPDDDIDLCRLAELGRDLKTWRKVKSGALHGWFRCSDGRLHHSVVAEGVLEAWVRRCKSSEKGKAGARARWSPGMKKSIAQAMPEAQNATAQAMAQAMPSDGNRQGQWIETEERKETEPSSQLPTTTSLNLKKSADLKNSNVVVGGEQEARVAAAPQASAGDEQHLVAQGLGELAAGLRDPEPRRRGRAVSLGQAVQVLVQAPAGPPGGNHERKVDYGDPVNRWHYALSKVEAELVRKAVPGAAGLVRAADDQSADGHAKALATCGKVAKALHLSFRRPTADEVKAWHAKLVEGERPAPVTQATAQAIADAANAGAEDS